MHRRLSILILAFVMFTLCAGTALAADGTKEVGLVIGLPDGTRQAQIITVPADATTIDVLKKANIVLISTNGQFGPAVCSINTVGCAAANCFCDSKHFWAFYHLDAASNKWVASPDGVGVAKPANGAVEGFVWSGLDDKFNPTDQPPVMSFAQIQAAAPAAAAPAAAAAAKPSTLPTTGGDLLLYGLAAGAVVTLAGLALRKFATRSI